MKPQPNHNNRQPYEPPAITYEGAITTRAGTKPGDPPPKDVNPAQLFGNVD